jgi:hypothetical protein
VTRPPEDPEPTRELQPPVPGPADPPLADQPTEQVPMPAVQPVPTRPVRAVGAGRPNRTAVLVTALVLLVLGVGVVAVLVWG